MEWILRLVGTGTDGQSRSADVMNIKRPDGLNDIADLGLTLVEAKQLVACVQREVVTAQADRQAMTRPDCRSCGGRCHGKDRRFHKIATLFGEMTVRLRRFVCTRCGHAESGVSWPSYCRSTPELDQLHAQLSAVMTYRVTAEVLEHLLPVHAGTSPETLRAHTLKVGERLNDVTIGRSDDTAAAIAVTLDSTFIRGREEGERHLEVRVGNVETGSGGRQVFGVVAGSDTDLSALIRRNLEAVGRTDDTDVTAFTDGCPGLRSVLVDAGITKPPILDWFHIAMRLRHAKQAADSLSTDNPRRAMAKAAIVAETERLRWRIWNGKAKNARVSINRIRAVMSAFKGEKGHRAKEAASHKLWHALHEVDGYLRGQSRWLVNYARRHRAGLRVGTSITEGTANFLVNRRMKKSQQMRWSRRGADLLLQVRCAVYNGVFGSRFGRRFDPHAGADPVLAKAA
jgi:hypothetical protein